MNEFSNALCSTKRNERIPEDYDFFGNLIGEWDIEWNDHFAKAGKRRMDILSNIRRNGNPRSFYRTFSCRTLTKQAARCRIWNNITFLQSENISVGYILWLHR